jgi:hypothetical protein
MESARENLTTPTYVGLVLGCGSRGSPMDAADFRAMAERCRELSRVAVRDDVRRQLRQWERDFEAEAEAVEKRREETRF